MKDYLEQRGCTLVDSSALSNILLEDNASNVVVYLVSSAIPRSAMEGESASLIRRFLDRGGKLISTGINPILFDLGNKSLSLGLNADQAEAVLGIRYGGNDLTSAKGIFVSFPTELGKRVQLPSFWLSGFSVSPSSVHEVLGIDEQGNASAWVRRYQQNGKFIQVWVNAERAEDYHYLFNLQ